MTELTATERETLAEAAYLHRTTGAPLGPAVEAILTARLARIEALVDGWDRLMDDGLCWCSSSTTDYAALRAALTAPTPDEVQP